MQDVVARVPTLSFIDMARRAGVRAARPVERRRRVRHLPLPHPAAERAGLLLLARSRHRQDHAALGVVRHQVAGGARSAPRQIKYMISFTLPRFCDQSLIAFAQGAVLPPAPATVDRQARYGRARALSHRSRADRHPPHRDAATAPTRPTATAAVLRAGRRDGHGVSGDRSPIRRSTTSCATTSTTLDRELRRRRRHELPHLPVVSAALHRAAGRAAAVARPMPTESRSSRWQPLARSARYTDDDLHVRQFTRAASRRLIRRRQFRAA